MIRSRTGAASYILRVPGPHNIPLIAHAEKGGAEAVAVVEFLRTLAS